MAERLKAAVLKTVVGKPTGGSNPSLSATLIHSNRGNGLQTQRKSKSEGMAVENWCSNQNSCGHTPPSFSWFLFTLTFLVLVATKAPADVYVLGDGGSSFSPHGYGATAGFRTEDIDIGIGTGSSKNGVAGLPVSFDMRILSASRFEHFKWQWGAGATRYKASGTRNVVFSEGGYSNNFRYKSDASWEFWYGRFAFGGVVERLFSPNIFLPFEVGFASILYSKVTADMDGIDGSNLGEPIGIDTGGYYDYHFMGPGDLGLYIRMGIGWDI